MKTLFRENLIELMDNKDLNINTLSKKANMQYKLIDNYVKGIYCPDLKNSIKLANYFKCSLDFLFGLSDDDTENVYSAPDFKFYERYLKLLSDRKTTSYKFTKSICLDTDIDKNWKAGSIPNISTLIKIAKELGVSIDYLIGRNIIK